MMHLLTNVITLLFPKIRMDTKSICRRMLCRLRIRPFGRNVMGGRKAAERIEQAFLKLQQYSA